MKEVGRDDGGEWIEEVAEFERTWLGLPALEGVPGWRTTRVVEEDPEPPRRWYLDCIGEVAR